MPDVAAPFTTAWLADLAAAAAATAVPDDLDATVEQVVTGGPDGDVRWSVRLAAGRAQVVVGPAPGADVSLSADWETALAMTAGELAVTDAFLAGRLRLRGDVKVLLRTAAVLEGLAAG
jgi:hypothetical protein